MPIELSLEQSRAVESIVNWYGEPDKQEFYLAGFAGVGKSTIANIAIEEIIKKYGIDKVYTAAYTGKAASVLRRNGVQNAQTIHSLIYTPLDEEEGQVIEWGLSGKSAAERAELIVLDECSMVDKQTADDLRSFDKKILIMGDPGQLPPISGLGAFSHAPDVFLREVHRQVAGSPILHLATLARHGKPLPVPFEEGNVRVLPYRGNQELIFNDDTQVICGTNRTRINFTQEIRQRKRFVGHRPMEGERLICCKNNRPIGLFNGLMGVLESIKCDFKGAAGRYELDVLIDEEKKSKKRIETDPVLFNQHFNSAVKRLDIPNKRLNEFDWGYLITCHKSQGSSWEHVTVIDESKYFRDNQQNWLYTAITRAEAGLTILV